MIDRNLTFPQVIDRLDLGKIGKEIDAVESAGGERMASYDFKDVRELVLIAAERWLPEDMEEWDIAEIEGDHRDERFRWILDMRGTHRGKLNAFKQFAGAGFILDWKTTKSDLNSGWANRYKYSHQWKLYAAKHPEVKLFHYRGIKRTGDLRSVIIQVPDTVVQESELYLRQTWAQREALIQIGAVPWPQRMPSGCNAYGRECEFFTDVCADNRVVAGGVDKTKPLSYSGCETFGLCPEKYRLLQLAERGEDDETLAFGKAFHRGIAELYKQVFF